MPDSIPDIDDLKLTFDLAPIGLLLSRERIIYRCNHAFASMFGHAAADLKGRSLEELYPSHEEFERTGARGLPIMRATGVYSDERIMRRHDGSLFWCRVSGRSIDPRDPFALAIWVFEDISATRPVGLALTTRERQIAALLVSGQTSKQIAGELAISPRTVEAHRARLMHKLAVKTPHELVARLLGMAR